MNNNDASPAAPNAPPRRRQHKGWIVVGLVTLLLLALAWFGREKFGFVGASLPTSASAARAGGRRFGGAPRTQPVSVQQVRRQDLHVVVNAIGTLTAANTATVRPQVSGVLQSLHFSEGEPVRAGQWLAQIDPRAFQATLAQAEGTLARDQPQLDNARVDLQRYQGLFAQDAVAKQTLDTQQAMVHQLEGTLRADEANVAAARLQLSYTRITAPISGVAGLKQADLGNVVGPADAAGIVVITQTRPMALVFSVPAAHLALISAQLKAGSALPVQAWDSAGKTELARGRIASLDNTIDTSTDSVRLKALFPNTDGALFPNQSVSVRLRVNTVHDALAVPQAALLRGAQGFYVYVVGADDTVSAYPVLPGPSDGQWTGVSPAPATAGAPGPAGPMPGASGAGAAPGAIRPLQAGDTVVVDGVDRLRDGAKVEVIAADPQQRQGATPPAGGRAQLSPALREKLRAMAPDERRAFIEKLRTARAASAASTGAEAAVASAPAAAQAGGARHRRAAGAADAPSTASTSPR